MSKFISGTPKKVREAIKWLKTKPRTSCNYCQKDSRQFKFLWIDPFLNVLCGCPGYHYALMMECSECGSYKEIAMGSHSIRAYCPNCFL